MAAVRLHTRSRRRRGPFEEAQLATTRPSCSPFRQPQNDVAVALARQRIAASPPGPVRNFRPLLGRAAVRLSARRCTARPQFCEMIRKLASTHDTVRNEKWCAPAELCRTARACHGALGCAWSAEVRRRAWLCRGGVGRGSCSWGFVVTRLRAGNDRGGRLVAPRSRWPCFRPRTRRRTPAQTGTLGERLAAMLRPVALVASAKLLPIDAICLDRVRPRRRLRACLRDSWRSARRPSRSQSLADCSTAGLWLQRGQMSWRDKIAHFLGLDRRTRTDGVEAGPADDIDPIEELARIINEAQERDAQDERRFDELARIAESEPKRARRVAPRPPIRRTRPF